MGTVFRSGLFIGTEETPADQRVSVLERDGLVLRERIELLITALGSPENQGFQPPIGVSCVPAL